MKQESFDPASKYCPLCGSRRLRQYSAAAFDSVDSATVSIQECVTCSFAWQYPLGRSADESRVFFEGAYNETEQATNDYFDPRRKQQIAALELGFVAQLPTSGKTILDVGAGSGAFALTAAEADWAVTAIDPALDCARLAGRPRVRAIKGSLDNIAGDSTFDIVTLWDVIEHAADPVDLIAQATRHVKKNGWLVVETGNFKSADRILGGREHWIYQLDHRWYFSPESIAKLLGEAGLANLVFSPRVLRPDWKGGPHYAGPSRTSLLKSLIRTPLQFQEHLRRHAELLGAKTWEMAGISIFTVAARRSDSDR